LSQDQNPEQVSHIPLHLPLLCKFHYTAKQKQIKKTISMLIAHSAENDFITWKKI
jgi:hypothetical protein